MQKKYILMGIFIGFLLGGLALLLVPKFFSMWHDVQSSNISSLRITDIYKDTVIHLKVKRKGIVGAKVKINGRINEDCEIRLISELHEASSSMNYGDTLRIPLKKGDVRFEKIFDWYHDKTILDFRHLNANEGNLDISVNLTN
ncbi:hypothetical protein SAMN04515674_10364 [Pseudarcicella hirudinis]|uniref:Uncharacterized protein n=1 Tax=Pseudarcicella hirudinis TaxID=1079859 RepID=A0A1I5Q806_9BACT|nr:hypothetical protein [Pseudarcicella hirudinis]SFP42498.1 hypothetical protein SAMN04515674_10364 [Pseudarcicella hirudinis]